MAQPDVRPSSSPKTPLEVEAWPKLDAPATEQSRQAGTTREVAAGDVLFDVGQEAYGLVYVERGAVGVIDRADDRVVTEVNQGDFVGEIGMLGGQRTFLAGVVPGHALPVSPSTPARALAEVGAFEAYGSEVRGSTLTSRSGSPRRCSHGECVEGHLAARSLFRRMRSRSAQPTNLLKRLVERPPRSRWRGPIRVPTPHGRSGVPLAREQS